MKTIIFFRFRKWQLLCDNSLNIQFIISFVYDMLLFTCFIRIFISHAWIFYELPKNQKNLGLWQSTKKNYSSTNRYGKLLPNVLFNNDWFSCFQFPKIPFTLLTTWVYLNCSVTSWHAHYSIKIKNPSNYQLLQSMTEYLHFYASHNADTNSRGAKFN